MNPNKAIGTDIGNKGWKKTAVRKRFPVFANLLAISRRGPEKSSLASNYVKSDLSPFLFSQYLFINLTKYPGSKQYRNGSRKDIESII